MLKYYNSEKIEVGIDEAGRGCLAGPVFTGAVILPKEFEDEDEDLINQIKDSKKLSRKKRSLLKGFIQDIAIDYSVTYKDNTYIDKNNILKSTLDCMHQSVKNLNIVPELILVDGNSFKPYYNDEELIENICVIGGDNKYLPIACASILAKEYHDEYIENLCNSNQHLDKYYNLTSNKGYGTKAHLKGLKKHGISLFHRKTFIKSHHLN